MLFIQRLNCLYIILLESTVLKDKGPVSGISDISVEDDLPDDETNPEEEWHQVSIKKRVVPC